MGPSSGMTVSTPPPPGSTASMWRPPTVSCVPSPATDQVPMAPSNPKDQSASRTNPNGCNIRSTFFVSHKYTNYTAVEQLHHRGHEIAVHSASHNANATWWSEASELEWKREFNGSRDMINRFA